MRILKKAETAIDAVAGEMLNIEMSVFHFIDGLPTTYGSEFGPKTAADYRGYPRLIEKIGADDDPAQKVITYDIKSTCGYIYVPVGFDIKLFEAQLMECVIGKEATIVRLDGRPMNNLKEYHTIQHGYNTNVMIKSAQNVTADSSVRAAPRNRRAVDGVNNVKRQFLQSLDDQRRGRFTWFIIPIDQFDDTISADNIEDAISRLASSIFYDGDDICKLNHNDVVFDFSKKYLRGYDLIVNEKITLFGYGHPLLCELNEHWRTTEFTSDDMRDIDSARVYSYDYGKLEFKPVRLIESSMESSIDICSKCRCQLYDENYALAGSTTDPAQTACIAICPICMHTGPDDRPIELKYYRVLRTRFPKTINDMIELSSGSDELKKMRKCAMGGYQRMCLNGEKGKCTLIGNDYIAFDNMNEFLFTNLSRHPILSNRKVCMARLIE